MKIKKLSLLVIAMLVVSTVAVAGVHGGTPPFANSPTVWVDDYSFYSEATDLTCTYFNVSVNVWNVSDMGAWEFYLDYNASLIKASYVYSTPDTANNTDWVPIDGGTYHPDDYPTIDNTTGVVHVGALVPTTGAGTGVYGDVTLVKIKFHIEMAPPRGNAPPDNISLTCALDLHDVVIGDALGHGITSYESDGSYTYTRGQIIPGVPTASFTYPAKVYVCTEGTVTSTSDPGEGATIVTYDWSLTGPATWTTPNNASFRKFHCDDIGDVIVTLNVTNSFDNWNAVSSNPIKQEPAPMGPKIDVYTEQERQYPEGTMTPYTGHDMVPAPGDPDPTDPNDADAYAPGENVTLYANVTYNNDPVQNIPVAFEVKQPWLYEHQGTDCPYITRTARTDENGIATISFRLPIPGPTYPTNNETAYFGHWWVMAKCKLQDDIINDTLRFAVDWIVRITDVHTNPADGTFAKYPACQYIPINVTLKNIAFLPRSVTVVVIIYDECDVPIGQVVEVFNIGASTEFCHPYVVTHTYYIHIPKWAYIGDGEVFANAFTAFPQNCGIPYCPEMSDTLTISIS